LLAVIAVFGLKTDCCGLSAQCLVVVAPLPHRFLRSDETVGRFDAELFDKPDRFACGRVPSFLLRCPNLMAAMSSQ
jgi:hypothetical protein